MQKTVSAAPPLLEVRGLQKYFQLHLLANRRAEPPPTNTNPTGTPLSDTPPTATVPTINPIKDVSFTARSRNVLLIRGRSGAGKTTILKCIYRTYLTSGGEIWYDSLNLGRIDLSSASEAAILQLREHELGYCSQFLKVLPRVPALDVVAEPLVRCGMKATEARAEAALWLARLGLEESRWQAYPITFSGGEQQRLNLARAFIASPRLLLLDEPTASLDPHSKSIVLEMISEAKARGVGIIVVSHDTQALESLADEIFWLADS
ncbi:MAG: ATP-binding cassette domain-containing protein [Chloroflexota bacterium]|nr:ATP-binding cassette domain-containing protein [Chloroflexota bacterium]